MDEVADHRNVMEHWGDVINPVDEASIIILGPGEIYKGNLNLHDVYTYVLAKLKQTSGPSLIKPGP
jgi:hypothetical protein